MSALLGRMMDRPLLIADILDYAAEVYGDIGIVSAAVEGGLHRTTYAQTATRARRLARALEALGIARGERVGTLAWNGYRHVELYYAVSGMGAVCHTINPRLSADQIVYIANHAEDRLIFADLTFIDRLEDLRDRLPAGLRIVAMTDAAHMPDSALDLLCYEDLLAAQPADYAWPELDERSASGLCYTSGTTGRPKGALYSHRSTVLQAMKNAIAFRSCMAPGCRILPAVPLFHVNAWSTPYAAPLSGAALVLPGPDLDGASLFALMEGERVFSGWGVPTVWMGLLAEIEKRGRVPAGLGEIVVGGSAASRALIEAFEARGVDIVHAWGMTEMSPIGTRGILAPPLDTLPEAARIDLKCAQGTRTFAVEMKIVDPEGRPLPHDGAAAGELYVRGPSVIAGYYRDAEADEGCFDAGGWFRTGDVARIDPRGFLTLTDRAKDMIKSGGEWISSIELENAAMAHPDIAGCAVIAVPDAKWDERPLLVAVARAGRAPAKADLLAHLAARFAKWQVPDDVVFVEELPLTATGKVSKLTLRAMQREGRLGDG